MSELGAAGSKHFPASVTRLLEDSMLGRHQSIFAAAVWANKAGTEPQLKNPLDQNCSNSAVTPGLLCTGLPWCSMFFHNETAATSIILHNGELQQHNPAKAISPTKWGSLERSCIVMGNTGARNGLRTILRDYSVVSPDSYLLP